MTSTAQRIADQFKDFNDAMTEATRVANCFGVEQDWENETTIFQFEDGSKLKFCHPFITVITGPTKQIVDVKEIRICPERRPAYNAVMVRWLMEEANWHRGQDHDVHLFLIVRCGHQIVQLVAYE